jgi:hypothetical protein
MTFLNNIPDSFVKAFFALLMLAALIAGFFMKLITPEIFTGFFGIVLTNYFKNEESKQLRAQIVQKDEHIAAMSSSALSVAALANGKEKQL